MIDEKKRRITLNISYILGFNLKKLKSIKKSIFVRTINWLLKGLKISTIFELFSASTNSSRIIQSSTQYNLLGKKNNKKTYIEILKIMEYFELSLLYIL